MKTFNNIEEMKEFYNEKTNLFYIDDSIELKFNLDCDWDIHVLDIHALHINARNIDALDIYANDINACNIKASDINYYAVCYAYFDIRGKSIKGRRNNCREFVLDGEIITKE